MVREVDKITTLWEPIVYSIWDPQHLKVLQVSTAPYGHSFTFHM
jgi:hypothetical protein